MPSQLSIAEISEINDCRMLSQHDSELLAQFRSGDKAAFEQVFRLYVKPLRLSAFLILRNEQEAEDLVQQLFLDIWNQGLYQHIESSLKSYLHTAIKHRCLNYLKKSDREKRRLREYAGENLSASLAADEEKAELVKKSLPGLLSVLEALPAQQSKAFHLVHMQNKRYQEAATEMGISINSVKSHLRLAVKFLRGKIRPSAIHPINK